MVLSHMSEAAWQRKKDQFNTVILLNGRQPWQSDPPDDEVMTLDQMLLAQENFGILAGCVHSGLNWDGTDTPRSPPQLIELIDALPREAHKTKLDPSVGAR